MNDLVNTVAKLQKLAMPAGIEIKEEEEHLKFLSPLGSTRLRLVPLYRPSAHDIERMASPDVLLVLTSPSRKALAAAANANYLVLSTGACRIVASGIAIIIPSSFSPIQTARQVKLTGRTGIVAETLLLGGARRWSVRDLAQASQVSPTLAHRVLARLEKEGLLLIEGSRPEKYRSVRDLGALAEMWSREERKPQTALRGFLYGSSTEAVAKQVQTLYPEGAVGGAFAANLYRPILTRTPLPLRFWVKSGFDPDLLLSAGFEQTEEGANIELATAKEDPWRVHLDTRIVSIVSKWRAWLEISEATGRMQELAEALLADLEEAQ